MTYNDKIKLSGKIALIAGAFCIVTASLLLLNYWQMSTTDPVESEVLEALVARLRQEPDNTQLINEIRNYDLLARKAYFNIQWQIKTGAYLLLGGAVILVVSLAFYYSLKAKIEEPDAELENEVAGRILTQKWIIGIGLAIFGIAFIGSFSSVNYLDRYHIEASAGNPSETQQEEIIEVIEVRPSEAESIVATEKITEESKPDKVVAEVIAEQPVPETERPASHAVVSTFSLEKVQLNHNSFRGPLGQGIIYHKNIPTVWNAANGSNILWKAPVPKHGFNSPLIWGDKVFVTGADAAQREVYCYSITDGKLLWTAAADNIPGSPASPPRVTEDTGLAASTATTDGRHVFAIFGTGDVIALDMSGNRVWSRNVGVPDNHYGHSSSLIVWENKLLVQYDTNKGGKLIALNTSTGETEWETSRESRVSWASPVLVQIDGNYQVVLTADPIVAGYDVSTGKELWSVECMMGEVGPSVAYHDGVVYAANEYAKMVAIDIKSQEILWEDDMFLPEASSPLAHSGLLFIATSYGVLVCYDAKTGEKFWEHDVGKTIFSSPVAADGKIYLMDNDGVMRVYEFGKELKLIAENELGEQAGTTPAFADGRIYLRGNDHLYCIGN